MTPLLSLLSILGISSWTKDDYKLVMQIIAFFLIVIILLYIGLSSSQEE